MKRTLLLIKTRVITSLVVLLLSMPVWGNDGDTFTEETVEGFLLTYTVISESEKTCMVGEEYNWPLPAARAERTHKVSTSLPSGDITIPEVANGYTVVRIEAYAFENSAITSVVIPNSVKEIGPGAFIQCSDLKTVRLPNQLTAIEWDTFFDCASLTSIDIPEGVTSIGEHAFYGCKQLKEANIPSSVVHFGKYVFCSAGFTSMPKLPGNLTTIPYGIFQSCPLTSVEIPQNITTIDGCAFNNCLFTEIEIPASVTHIGVAAFARCKNLSSIVIPDNVTNIDFNAFKECTNLRTVTLSSNLSSLSEGVLSECSSLESVIIPNGVKTIGRYAFSGCTALRSISISETVEEIGDHAFSSCSSLTKLFIPKGVVKIETEGVSPLLYACSSLTSIIVDEENPVYDSRNNCNAIIETATNKIIAGCPATKFSEGITSIGSYAFCGLANLTSVTLPQSLNRIEGGAFNNLGLRDVNIPENVNFIGAYAFSNCTQLESVRSYIKEPFEISEKAFSNMSRPIDATLYVPQGTVDKYKSAKGWTVFSSIKENTEPDVNMAYRPFVEEGKVWKLGAVNSGNPVQWVEYYYFDGDTIIDGRICKQMVRQRYFSPDYPEYDSQRSLLSYVGAWYEEDKKVYEYDLVNKQFRLMYDFSLEDNGTFQINDLPYVYMVGPRQTGGMKGFKGVYREVLEWADGESYKCAPWLEGVGGIYAPPTTNIFNVELADPAWFLMSCTVGDEVIYLNDEYEDGATPESVGARKDRIDFTHTIKTRPKAPRQEMGARASSPAPVADGVACAPVAGEGTRVPGEAEQSIYGEYSALQLGINLDPLSDAYLVRITDETGNAVYEKAVDAASIVGLNIDISAYAEGRYTVTVENDRETFTGQFETQTTGIEENALVRAGTGACPYTGEGVIYNLQGQRIRSLQKGLNIVCPAEGRLQGKTGRKVFVR